MKGVYERISSSMHGFRNIQERRCEFLFFEMLIHGCKYCESLAADRKNDSNIAKDETAAFLCKRNAYGS